MQADGRLPLQSRSMTDRSSSPPFSRPSASDLLSRRRCLQAGLAVAGLALSCAARAGYNIWTGEYTVPFADLKARLARRFPVQMSYAEIFSLQLENPSLALNPSQNRLQLTADMQISNPLFNPRSAQGVLAISSGLVFDSASSSLRLHEPKAERLELQGLSERDGRRLKDVGQLATNEALNNYALYTFKPDELRMGLKTLQPGAITVLDDGVKIALQ